MAYKEHNDGDTPPSGDPIATESRSSSSSLMSWMNCSKGFISVQESIDGLAAYKKHNNGDLPPSEDLGHRVEVIRSSLDVLDDADTTATRRTVR